MDLSRLSSLSISKGKSRLAVWSSLSTVIVLGVVSSFYLIWDDFKIAWLQEQIHHNHGVEQMGELQEEQEAHFSPETRDFLTHAESFELFTVSGFAPFEKMLDSQYVFSHERLPEKRRKRILAGLFAAVAKASDTCTRCVSLNVKVIRARTDNREMLIRIDPKHGSFRTSDNESGFVEPNMATALN